MATLTLTVGPITATVTAGNAQAATILNAYADAIGATGTDQERTNAVVHSLARHIVGVARNQRQEAARLAAQAEIDLIDWGG